MHIPECGGRSLRHREVHRRADIRPAGSRLTTRAVQRCDYRKPRHGNILARAPTWTSTCFAPGTLYESVHKASLEKGIIQSPTSFFLYVTG